MATASQLVMAGLVAAIHCGTGGPGIGGIDRSALHSGKLKQVVSGDTTDRSLQVGAAVRTAPSTLVVLRDRPSAEPGS